MSGLRKYLLPLLIVMAGFVSNNAILNAYEYGLDFNIVFYQFIMHIIISLGLLWLCYLLIKELKEDEE